MIGAAEEFLIGAQVGRQDVEHFQLGEDVLVDVVVFRRVGPLEARLGLEIGEPNRDQLLQIAAQDGHFAALAELDQAGRLTRAMAVSLLVKTVSRVTSRVEPSAKWP